VNRVFGLENLKGVIDVCTTACPLDDAIIKGVRPNLDVLPTGGRSKNPTQILAGKEFAQMISDLRKRYDRVFVDTPPVAIVSDALVVVPLVDGVVYAIYFNKVKRRRPVLCPAHPRVQCDLLWRGVERLAGGVGGYYYSHYYDKSYKDYYVGRPGIR